MAVLLPPCDATDPTVRSKPLDPAGLDTRTATYSNGSSTTTSRRNQPLTSSEQPNVLHWKHADAPFGRRGGDVLSVVALRLTTR